MEINHKGTRTQSGESVWEWTRCPVCGSPDSEPHRTVTSLFSEVLFARPSQPIHLVRCRSCRLVYVNPRPIPEVHRRLLTKSIFWGASFENYVAREEALRREARARLLEISKTVRPGRLLDVGCCCGFLLDEARCLGWSVLGAEVSSEFVEYARQRFGLDILNMAAEELRLPPESIDLITLWGVLEYTYCPTDIFRSLHRSLTPEGIIYFSVANIRSVDYWLLGKRWPWLYPPAHLVHFSKRPLYRMLQQAGFRVCRLWSEPGPDDLLAAWVRSLLPQSGQKEENRPGIPNTASAPGSARARIAEVSKRVYRAVSPLICRLGIGGKLVVIAQKE